jgi:hypothetical protein
MVKKTHIKMLNPLVMVILTMQMDQEQLMRINILTLINLLPKTKTKDLMMRFIMKKTLKEVKINKLHSIMRETLT